MKKKLLIALIPILFIVGCPARKNSNIVADEIANTDVSKKFSSANDRLKKGEKSPETITNAVNGDIVKGDLNSACEKMHELIYIIYEKEEFKNNPYWQLIKPNDLILYGKCLGLRGSKSDAIIEFMKVIDNSKYDENLKKVARKYIDELNSFGKISLKKL